MTVKNVLFVASEAEPYAKSGGLADVVSALPKALNEFGINVKIIIPLYSSIDYKKYGIKKVLDSVCVHMGGSEEWFSVHHTDKPHGIDVYFIEFDKYFFRNGLYHDSRGEFGDNLERFSFFSKAALQTAKDLKFKPDIVHCHDWQTSLIPYYLKTFRDPFYVSARSVLTLHNMGYQGIFDTHAINYAMIAPWDFTADKFEAFGNINLLKGGIRYADKITTVSPTYAEEILGPIGSNGLDSTLQSRSDDLVGILNGIDTSYWNPALDKLIPVNYTVDDYKKGKAENKKALQKYFGLEINSHIPIFAVISRFAEQKGLNLLKDVLTGILDHMICQFVVLGSGDQDLEIFFAKLPSLYKGSVGSYIGYNEPLAHLIEAGADFFVMPSLYEPCGLNQMYSQVYGTLPVVRSVGGLADTVKQYNEGTGTGTGFKFYDINSSALYYTIGWVVSTYYDRPSHISKMIENAMVQDYSWENSAKRYIDLYNIANL